MSLGERYTADELDHLGNEFESMQQDGSSVTSRFKGGMESNADLLVAADGFRSSIRGLLLSGSSTRVRGLRRLEGREGRGGEGRGKGWALNEADRKLAASNSLLNPNRHRATAAHSK